MNAKTVLDGLGRALLGVALLVLVAPAGSGQEPAADENLFRSFAVPENRTAHDIYEDALRFLAERRYASALPNLQRLLDQYANKVILSPERAPGESLYHGLGSEVGALLRDLSPEGRKLYRELYDAHAARMLLKAVEARSLEALFEVVRRYRYTSSGGAAVEALGDVLLEQGHACGAAHFYRQLARSPDPEEQSRFDVRKWIYALAQANLHEEALAAGRELVARAGSTRIEWRGKSVSIESLIERWTDLPLPERRERWICVGGDASHTRPMPALRTVSRLEWQEPIHVLYELDQGSGYFEYLAPFQPVIGRGKVFVHNGLKVWAFSLSDGHPRWKFSGEQNQSTDRPTSRMVYSGALIGSRYFANLEVPVNTPEHYYHAIPIQKKIPVRKLFAFDADTGERLWSHSNGRIPAGMNRDDRSFIARVNIPSPPTPWNDCLLTGASYFEGKIYCYLTSIESRTGHLRWRTLVCTGQEMLNMFGRPMLEPVLGIPAVANGVAYFTSNLGVVAAVDAHLGRIRWLTTYPKRPRRRQSPMVEMGPQTGWRLCPTVVQDGVVVTAPLDSNQLVALDAESGRILWTVDRQQERVTLRYLLGARDGLVVASGNGLVALDLRTGKPKWPVVAFPRHEQTTWRGALTTEGILVPTEKHLRAYDLHTGELLVKPPAKWESATDQSGNLVAAGEDLLVTVSRLISTRISHLNVFYNRRERVDRLTRLATLRPWDPEPRLDLARTLAQAGLVDEAEAEFSRAVGLARRTRGERGRRLTVESVRGRYDVLSHLAIRALNAERFAAATQFVNRALESSVGFDFHLDALLLEETLLRRQGKVRELAGLYGRLRKGFARRRHAFADRGEIPVGLYARLQAAAVERTLGRPHRAVEEFQGIIREFPGETITATRRPARTYAIEAIEALIARHGRSVYARQDAIAEEIYRIGLEKNAPEFFLRVITGMPNARVVGRCRLAYALAARREGDPVGAIRTLRRYFLWKAAPSEKPSEQLEGDDATTARALVALIEAYRDLGRAEAAQQLTDRLAARFADTRFAVGKETTTGRAWAEANRSAPRPAPTYADREHGTPFKAWTEPIEPGLHLEVLEQTAPPRARRLLLATTVNRETDETVLTAYGVTLPPARLWQAELPTPPSRPLDHRVTVTDGLVILPLDAHLLALDAATGALRWRREYPDRRVMGAAVREGVVLVVSIRRPTDYSAGLQRYPIVEALELVTGETVWQHDVGGEFPLPPMTAGRQVVVTVRKNPSEIRGFDLLTGKPGASLRTSDQFMMVDPVPAGSDGLLITPDSHSELWLAGIERLEARWRQSLLGTEIDTLISGRSGCLVAATTTRSASPRKDDESPPQHQLVYFFDPEARKLAWQWRLEAKSSFDFDEILEDGDQWILPVRESSGRVHLAALDRRGKTAWETPALFGSSTFQTLLFRVYGGVLAFSYDPTSREERKRPSAHLVMVDPTRGRVIRRWALQEPAPPRGRGIWPTPTGFFIGWPDRIEDYDMGNKNDR